MTAAERDAALPLTDEEVFSLLSRYENAGPVALALSGGPDSMALCAVLSRWNKVPVHALTVDHGLRPDSADEAQQVAAWVSSLPAMTHHILPWIGDKPSTRIMEEARRARYTLMADYCRAQGITFLFAAHHQDDQAETFLIRLAAGSGLDGLGGMRAEQPIDNGITLVRPFLSVAKDRLIATCRAYGVPYVTDPSNTKADYLRPRLRAARDVLEDEGLTAKRLSVTALRLSRARDAMEYFTARAMDSCRTEAGEARWVFDYPVFAGQPAEIRLRLLLAAMEALGPDRDYAPRMEKAEDLLYALENQGFKGRTLGGCTFALKGGGKALYVERES